MYKLIYVRPEGSFRNRSYILVGEAPGAQEELEGRPFVGRSGQFLREVFNSLGVPTDTLYITNVLKIRPELNRTPTPEEIDSWLPILDQEIADIYYYGEKVVPIIALGKTAQKALSKLPYAFHHVWHPAYALRSGKRDEFINSIKVLLNPSDE